MNATPSAPGRILYQFPISHFCEKSRWNLDAKGLAYEVKNLFPAVHRVLLGRMGGATVPVLVDGGAVLTDSRAIALHLERAYPAPALFPADPAARARAEELAAYFDRSVGPAARRWAYGYVLDTPGALWKIFFQGYGPWARALGKPVGPVLRAFIRRAYGVTPAGVEKARAAILAGADRLEEETKGDPARHLVGDTLSIADISAAAMLAAVVGPAGSPYAGDFLPDGARELRDALRRRPAGAWVTARYARDRRAASA